MGKGVAVTPTTKAVGKGGSADTSAEPSTDAGPDGRASQGSSGSRSTRLVQNVHRSGWLAVSEDGPQPLDRRSTVPLYVQIRRRLLSLIAGWPDPQKRFYTDDELCKRFGVARMTVRAAIREFVDEGLLTRVRGAGTFVSFEKIEERFSPRMDFIDQYATRGRPLSLDVRRLETLPSPAPFASALDIPAGSPVLFVERLRSTGPVPVSIDYRYILPEAATHISEAAARERSLLELLTGAVELDHADMTIEADTAEGATAETLELMPGDPVLVRGLVYSDTAGRPVMAGISFYRSDQTGYSIRVPLGDLTAPAVDRAGLDGDAGALGDWGRLVHIRQEIRGT